MIEMHNLHRNLLYTPIAKKCHRYKSKLTRNPLYLSQLRRAQLAIIAHQLHLDIVSE